MRLYILFGLIGLLLSSNEYHTQETLSLDDAVLKQWTDFYPERPGQLQWIKNTPYYSYVEENILYKGSVKDDKIEIIDLENFVINTRLDFGRFPSINWISDNSFTFKHSSGILKYTIDQSKAEYLFKWSEESAYGDLNDSKDKAAYLKDNNVLVLTKNGVRKITDNPDHIVSGQAFARQEFGIVKGTFWSPNGNSLAFYQKDESQVTDYPLVEYNTKPASVRFQKYPMAGEPSEKASVGIFHFEKGSTSFLKIENGKNDDSYYATNLAWSPDNQFIYLAIVDRDQKKMKLVKYDAESGDEIAVLFEESNERYVEPEHPPIFLEGKDQFLWFSERDGYNNIYHYNTDGKLLNQTKFNFPITSFVQFDDRNKNFFVMGTGANATESHLYKISLSNFKVTQLTTSKGRHSVAISENGKYILDTYSSIETPCNVELRSSTGKKIKLINSASDPLAGYDIGTPEIFQLKSFDETPLWCRLIKPSNFDKNKQYPVLVYVYNGPHVQLVKDSYLGGASLWMYYMAEQGYLVFTVDGRGSANRGFDFESSIHRQLGEIEIKDQEFCTNWLKDQPYTDENRFAVHGWSYGGFMTTSLMLKKPDLYNVGVAGGPVMDWHFYEAMYTERYMDTPQSNKEGFDRADLKNFVDELKGELLLIHGAIDDVVVMQHTMTFLETCVKKGVQVDFFAYPGHPHNVRGKDRVHLMTKVLDYIMENN